MEDLRTEHELRTPNEPPQIRSYRSSMVTLLPNHIHRLGRFYINLNRRLNRTASTKSPRT